MARLPCPRAPCGLFKEEGCHSLVPLLMGSANPAALGNCLGSPAAPYFHQPGSRKHKTEGQRWGGEVRRKRLIRGTKDLQDKTVSLISVCPRCTQQPAHLQRPVWPEGTGDLGAQKWNNRKPSTASQEEDTTFKYFALLLQDPEATLPLLCWGQALGFRRSCQSSRP